MPPLRHWIMQYLFAVVSMFTLLMVVDLLRGETLERAWVSALMWATVASAIFIGTRYRNMKRGIAGNALDKK
ncbi:hypothetical protein ACHAC9_01180 [Massilia sp. CMS3.1]|uniref:hypothetical protein n=1 Tax=Massilia sp. CMS3.1 TaxID=3373083 RepID=UPI003EE4D545